MTVVLFRRAAAHLAKARECLLMIRQRLCDMIGIKYPIIQAGMGPFSNNNLCVAAANSGVLGLLSTSGLFSKDTQPWIYNHSWIAEKPAGMTNGHCAGKGFEKDLSAGQRQGRRLRRNVMVSAELMAYSTVMIDTAIKVREENPELRTTSK